MKIRRKISLAFAFGSISLLLVLLLITEIVLKPQYENLERNLAQENIYRLKEAFVEKTRDLSAKASDWTVWDDTYKFIQGQNKSYPRTHLFSAPLKELDADLVAFVNAEGKVLLSAEVDPVSFMAKETGPRTPWSQFFIFNDGIFSRLRGEQRILKVAKVGNEPVLLAVLPIRKSDATGDYVGYFALAQRIDAAFEKDLASLLRMDLKIRALDAQNAIDYGTFRAGLQIQDDFITNLPSTLETVDEDTLRARVYLPDLQNQIALVAEVPMKRDITKQGRENVRSVGVIFLLGVLAILGLTTVLIEKTVVGHIWSLADQVGHLISNTDLSIRTRVQSKDEIKQLSLIINKMLQKIERSQKALKTLLDNTGQAFFAVEPNGFIRPTYSEITTHLFQIDPKGKTLAELFRRPTDEIQEWIDLFFSATLDFDSVAELGPKELEIEGHSIRLQYRPIRGKEGTLQRVMVIATDVTEVKALEKQNELERQRNLALIKIISAKTDFMELVEISEGLPGLVSSFVDLKRKIHTLKGGLGFFGCQELMELCHHWETVLNENPSQALQAAQEIRSAVAEFVSVNDSTLQIHNSEKGLVPVSLLALDELVLQARHHQAPPPVIQQIEQLGLQPCHKVLGWMNEAWIKTAEDLGKEVTPIEWLPSEKIRADLYTDLLKSFIHIARNAADHGIEMPDDREVIEKPRQGSLKAQLILEGDFYTLVFQDDGAGANIARIGERARSKGLLVPSHPDGVIDLLFHDGFSTKTEVSATSGRGVGLDAVRTEARKLDGDIIASSAEGQGMRFTIRFRKIKSLRTEKKAA